MKKVELVAPAGNYESLYASLENGADAVYLGLKHFSARNFAKNFELEEIPNILSYAHSKGKKVYITLNTLIKEKEVKEIFEILKKLEKYGVDAIIFQDFSIIELVKKYFPTLRLHASTQLTNINSNDINFLSKYVKRVVIERQIYIDEIKEIFDKTDTELECFIHGAICYSISGQCLFSSFLGGQSGNRGRCTQPCRRLYYLKNRKGYYFSPNDLEALSVIEELIKLGVNAFKIEGRMKSAQYVGNVVKAYRILIDDFYLNKKISDFAKKEAKEYLKMSFGRKTTPGFFVKPLEKMVEPKLSGNTGLFIGKVLENSNKSLKFKTLSSIELLDRIRVQSLKEDEQRISFRIKKIFDSKYYPIKKAEKGKVVIIPLEKKINVKKGDLIFKIQAIKSKVKLKDEQSVKNIVSNYKHYLNIRILGEFVDNSLIFYFKDFKFIYNPNFFNAEKTSLNKDILLKYFNSKFEKRGFNLDLEFKIAKVVIPQKELKKIGDDLAGKIEKIIQKEDEIKPEVEFKEIIKIPPERFFYFKMPSIYDVLLFPDNFSDYIILPIHPHTEEIYNKYRRKFDTLRDQIVFYIDDLIFEEKISFYNNKINFLKEKGFYRFYLNTKSEFEFFKDELNYFLIASENFHVANTISMEFLKKLGFSKIVLDVENDEQNLKKFFFKIDAVVPIFSYIKLMKSRIPTDISKNSVIEDHRKKEKYFFKIKKDYYELIHTEPFSIANHLEELYRVGYRNFLIDISLYLKYKNNFKAMLLNFKKGIPPVKTTRDFNYLHGWE